MDQIERWDRRFIDLAALVSTWSKDPSTKCGAVIVDPSSKAIVSTGFNGFPIGTKDSRDEYDTRELKYQKVVHAEQNALLLARCDLRGFTIYTFPPGKSGTCDRCAALVIQAGIKRVVHLEPPEGEEFGQGRWSEAEDRALRYYQESGVEVVSYPIEPGIAEMLGDTII